MPLIAGPLIFLFALLIIACAVFLFIFWLRMLIDCAKRDFPSSSERVVWIVMLVFFQFIASVVYYFAVYKKPKA